jgi:hypothetical protein
MDRWYGYKASTHENWRSSDDFRQARLYALQLNDDDSEGAELFVAWLSRRAELVVERKWSQIQKLSHALLEFGKIDGSEITHIVQGREQPHRFV